MPFSLIPFILLIVPILEIAVFVWIGGQIGIWWTLASILFTAILGSILLRIEGLRTLFTIQTKMNAGELPARELGVGALLLVAGILLLTPGFVTDFLGFLLFVPQVRVLLWKFVSQRFARGIGTQQHSRHDWHFDSQTRRPSGNPGAQEEIIDLEHGEYRENSPWKKD